MSLPGESERGLRYMVRSLSGYVINPSSPALTREAKRGTEWYVLDTAYCCQIVASFKNTKANRAEEKARKLCRELNLDERRWENQCWREDRERELARERNGAA